MNAVVRSTANLITVGAATSADVRTQIVKIQECMRENMKDGVHFGIIPGTPKPSLWKPGAEMLCTLFHIAPSYREERVATDDGVEFHFVCVGTHQESGVIMGEGVGSCSTDESKYRWRTPVCDNEYAATPENRRRLKWNKDGSSYKQIRTEQADLRNTVKKMAAKRAQIAMVLNVTAASDCFAQEADDIDMSTGEVTQRARPARPASRIPQSNRSAGQAGIATDAQQRLIRSKADAAQLSAEQICKHFAIDSISVLAFDKVNAVLAYIADANRDAPSPQAE